MLELLRKAEMAERAVTGFIETTRELDEASFMAAVCLLIDIACEERNLDKAEFAHDVHEAVSVCGIIEELVEG